MDLLATSGKAEAIIGYNDVCATAWSLAAWEHNVKCPVVGFDGTPFFRALPYRFPYVDLRPAAVSEAAVDVLMGLLRGQKPRPRSLSVDPVFVCS